MDLLAQVFNPQFQTNIPLIFKAKPFIRRPELPLFVALIGPSGAGKDTIKNKLLQTGKFFYIKTATTRLPRKNETDADYIWMRQKKDGEPLSSYLRMLVNQYHLLEFSYHYGNMYGTPYESIKTAFLSGRIPLACTENHGALFLQEVLGDMSDVLTIGVVPDSLEDMKKRILTGSRDNTEKRLEESLAGIQQVQEVAHFIVKNPTESIEYGKTGLESAVGAVKQLIASF